MSEQANDMTDPADQQELERLFAFLARIQAEPQLAGAAQLDADRPGGQ